ncbi:MAG: hypothetical protein ACKV2T_08845 [Kofleriaceae bacterium]
MRIAIAFLLVACAAAPTVKAPESDLEATPVVKRDVDPDVIAAPPVDPILGLAPPTHDAEVSWISPGPARIEIASSPIETAPPNAAPVAGSILDAQGTLVRVAIRLDHARFLLWMDRARMFGVMKQEQEVRVADGMMPSEAAPLLFPGARVKRLARRDGFVQIRYVGALEFEGWVPETSIGDRGTSRSRGRIPTGTKTLTLMPGSIIRAKPDWSGTQVALAANNYFVDVVRELDPKWTEVHYMDGEIRVRGFYQRYSPPGRTHRERVDPNTVPIPIAANAKVASGTCLYARVGGDAVGYIVGDRDVSLESGTNHWWTLAIDTPWGPISFAARGEAAIELDVCAPPSSVPASTLVPAATSP